MWLHSGGYLPFGALPGCGGFPRAFRGAVDPRLRLLPGGPGDPAAALRERRQAAPRHGLLLDGQAAALALLGRRAGCEVAGGPRRGVEGSNMWLVEVGKQCQD